MPDADLFGPSLHDPGGQVRLRLTPGVTGSATFGGMRDHHGTISFAPRLPSRLNRMVFRLAVGTGCIEVQIDAGEATYQLVYGEKMELVHHGEAFILNDEPITLAIPPTRAGEPPTQPVGREPYRRSSTI